MSGDSVMDRKQYDQLFLGCFVTSDRDIRLYKEVEKYFKETENLGSIDARTKSRELSQWCKDNSFSHSELVHAKRLVQQQL